MRPYAYQRIWNTGVLLLVLVIVWLIVRSQERHLVSSAFTTGYLLIGAVVFLALYNVRKKLPFLPLGSSATWLTWHLYVGLGTLALFGMHVGLTLPRGILDSFLACIYLLTFTSGVIGLYFTRTIPAQLARVGEEVIYERIPAFRRQVRQQAADVVLESVSASGATTLADFYTRRLYAFFVRPRSPWYQLRPTTRLRRGLMREMEDLRRYLSDQEQRACEKLFALIRRKDDLDYHEARQGVLKGWLFVHIALSYTLVFLAGLHGLLAHAFAGGDV